MSEQKEIAEENGMLFFLPLPGPFFLYFGAGAKTILKLQISKYQDSITDFPVVLYFYATAHDFGSYISRGLAIITSYLAVKNKCPCRSSLTQIVQYLKLY